jgi:hypothetical protein
VETGSLSTGTTAKGWSIYKITTNYPARIQLYGTRAACIADTGLAFNSSNVLSPSTARNVYTLPPFGQEHQILTDLVLDGSYNSIVAAITNVALTSNVITITTDQAHGLSMGDSVKLGKLLPATQFNNATLTVASAPTTTTFTANYSYADYTSAANTGAVYQQNYKGWRLSPPAVCFNVDSPQGRTVYYAITNLDTSANRSITMTMYFTPTES